jgi:RNA polymerase sigma-70 factor (ECF subfamily)
VAREWDTVATRLVAERGDALVRYAFLLTGSREDAADVVQDALVRTFGRPRPALTAAKAEAFVRRTILNAVIDRSRRTGTWRRVRHLVGAPSVLASPTDASDTRLDLAERVRALSPRQAACIVLRYYEDLTVDQIASTLGISQGAVKRYLSDALRALASALDAGDAGRSAKGDTDVRA